MESLEAALFEQRMQASEKDRLERYKKNWSYYNGAHKQPLAVRQGQPDDNVILNLARLIVDKGVAFLFGKDVGMELQEGKDTGEEQYLRAVWKANKKRTYLAKVGMGGGIFGHVFVKISPAEGVPRLINLEPENVRVYWKDDDIDVIWKYRIEWVALGKDGKAIHRRQDITEDGNIWQIENLVAKGNDVWKPDPENPDSEWRYSFSPIVDCQNLPSVGTFYGVSDLEDLSEQDAINYLASKMQRIIRYHAHPKTVGKGFAPDDVRITEDETIVLPSSDSDLSNLEMQSDLAGSLNFMDRLINWYLSTARVPRLDPAQVNVGALSGFALTVLYGDLLEKTELKRGTYGDLLSELNRRILAIAGKGDNWETTLHWRSPLPTDQASAMMRDQFELDYGIASKETVQVRRELAPEVENTRIEAQEVQEGNVGALLLRQFERNTRGQE